MGKRQAALEMLLAATDDEVTAGASKEQLKALADRLPCLSTHIARLLAQEAKESEKFPGLVIINVSVTKSHGKTESSHTNVETSKITAQLGKAQILLTLQVTEVVNAEAEYCAWWITDLETGAAVFPRGPIELNSDGEMVGEGAQAPTPAQLEAFRTRCALPDSAGLSCKRWFGTFLEVLYSEAKTRVSKESQESSLWECLTDSLEEYLDP